MPDEPGGRVDGNFVERARRFSEPDATCGSSFGAPPGPVGVGQCSSFIYWLFRLVGMSALWNSVWKAVVHSWFPWNEAFGFTGAFIYEISI